MNSAMFLPLIRSSRARLTQRNVANMRRARKCVCKIVTYERGFLTVNSDYNLMKRLDAAKPFAAGDRLEQHHSYSTIYFRLSS